MFWYFSLSLVIIPLNPFDSLNTKVQFSVFHRFFTEKYELLSNTMDLSPTLRKSMFCYLVFRSSSLFCSLSLFSLNKLSPISSDRINRDSGIPRYLSAPSFIFCHSPLMKYAYPATIFTGYFLCRVIIHEVCYNVLGSVASHLSLAYFSSSRWQSGPFFYQ